MGWIPGKQEVQLGAEHMPSDIKPPDGFSAIHA